MHTQNDGQYTVLINCLREQRLASGQTQQQLAEKLGVNQSYVSKYEQCQRKLDFIELRRIVLALGTTLPSFTLTFESRLRKLGLN
ncbi:MAG TPA: helix-turn-helix transcriptional regulator [Candidatus Scatomorpha merdavium]|nr:helix-turn-helix transcriptional regulator [Candidatus Scatomorpha merdavium]